MMLFDSLEAFIFVGGVMRPRHLATFIVLTNADRTGSKRARGRYSIQGCAETVHFERVFLNTRRVKCVHRGRLPNALKFR